MQQCVTLYPHLFTTKCTAGYYGYPAQHSHVSPSLNPPQPYVVSSICLQKSVDLHSVEQTRTAQNCDSLSSNGKGLVMCSPLLLQGRKSTGATFLHLSSCESFFLRYSLSAFFPDRGCEIFLVVEPWLKLCARPLYIPAENRKLSRLPVGDAAVSETITHGGWLENFPPPVNKHSVIVP